MTTDIDEILRKLDKAKKGAVQGAEAGPAFEKHLETLIQLANDIKAVSGTIESTKRVILEPVAREIKKSTLFGILFTLLGVFLGGGVSYLESQFFPATAQIHSAPVVNCGDLPKIQAPQDISLLLKNIHSGVVYLESQCMGINGEKLPGLSDVKIATGGQKEILKDNENTISLYLFAVEERDGVRQARFRILSNDRIVSPSGLQDIARVIEPRGTEGLSGETILVNEGSSFVIGKDTKVTLKQVLQLHTTTSKVSDGQDAVLIKVE